MQALQFEYFRGGGTVSLLRGAEGIIYRRVLPEVFL